MSENGERKRWAWPAAFFILNLAAIVVWFAWYSNRASKELAVAAMTPSGTGVDAGGVAQIKIAFNLPLDPETVKPDSVRLVPPVPGKTELAAPDAIVFLPREPLSAATGYTVILSPGLRGKRGEPPPRDLLEFSTTRFQLESAAQAAFDRDSHTVELVFNQPIAASDLERAIAVRTTLDRQDAASLVKVVGNANSRRQRLRIGTNQSALFLLTLPAGLAGSAGPLGLDKEEKLLWRVVGPGSEPTALPAWAKNLEPVELRPEVAFLGMTSEWDDGSGVVRVRTTAPLELEKAAKYVKIAPEIPFTLSPTWNGLKILADFQPGKQYRVTLSAGMPAGYAGSLPADVSRQVWFDDLPASLNFPYGGGFLSPDGMLKVAVRSRNVGEFQLGLRKLYASNIVESLLRDYDEEVEKEYAEPEIVKTVKTDNTRNREAETLLDLPALLGEKPLGVYGLEIWQENRRWYGKNALVAVSDLGLSTRQGKDLFFAWATSIREGTPRAGVEVKLYSNKRQLLAQGKTGDDGVAKLTLLALADGETPALLLGDAGNGEFSFVRLERDMKARPAETRRGPAYAEKYQVFLTADRGVYRGGEKVMLAGLVRDHEIDTVPDLPLDILLIGPDGKQIRQSRAKADAAGRLTLEEQLGESFAGGIYTLEARLPGQNESLGQTMFRVADYLPESLSVAMEFKDKKPETPEDHTIWIKVARLAGGELGEMPATVRVEYRPAPFAPDGWDGWTFGDSRRNGSADRRERTIGLNANGEGAAEWTDPNFSFPAAARMTVRAEVSETGGRAVAGSIAKSVHDTPYYVGIDTGKRMAKAGSVFALPMAAVKPDGKVEELDAQWTGQLYRVEYTGVMKKNTQGRLVYEWVRKELPEAKLSGIWKNGRSEARPTPVAGGAYRMIIDSEGGRGCVFDFTVEGDGASWHGEDPETLAIELDKEQYSVGDQATASTRAPFAGIALITVETDEVLSHWLMEFKQGDNTFIIPVDENMRPNAYVAATLVRPAHTEAEWKPHRLSGAARLKVDNRDRRLAVELATPDVFKPGKDGSVTVKVMSDGKPAANAAVVVWAVDVGVLSLTDYRAESPWDWFYQARRAEVKEADMYSRLAPELAEWLGSRQAAPGGDGSSSDDLARRLNPIFASRVKPAVVFEAGLTTGEDGTAVAELSIPQFAGRLRLMCWAAGDKTFGNAEKEIEVKAPVSVAAAWPRFAAPGDEFTVPLTVINRSGRDGTAMLVFAGDASVEFELKNMAVELRDNQAKQLFVSAKALKAGVAKIGVTATLDNESFSDRVELSVRPPVLFARQSGTLEIPAGAKADLVLAKQLIPENSRVKLLAGGSPQIALSGGMEALLDYPYGCAEQTASRLLALAYLPDVLALSRPDQLESGEASRLATACVERLSSMQTANGSLRMWPGAGEELFWVSAQALFSLTETKAAGHEVPKRLIDNLSEYLDSRLDAILSDEAFEQDNGESAAQAVLSLSKAGKLKRSWLLRLEEIAEARAKKNAPLASSALAFLCEAVALAGDAETASSLFRRFNPDGEKPGLARNQIIDLSAWLMAAMAVGDDARHTLAAQLSELSRDSFSTWTTRENSLALAALGRYWQNRAPAPEATIRAKINGVPRPFSNRKGGMFDKLSAGTRVEVDNASAGSLRLYWVAEGIPESGTAKEEDKGLTARRRVYDSKGKEISGPYTLRQGEIYEIRLTVGGTADDLVLVDLLPAGLEIEDASLGGRPLDGDAAKGLDVTHVEIKDDRLLVFASLEKNGEYRYLVRAATGGAFVWPALDAGRMYDATARSVSGSGRVKIVGGKEAANDR